jgi:hypothetical protein
MPDPITRRTFAASCAATVVLGREALSADTPEVAPMPHAVPVEAHFVRDYPKPGFNPSWRSPQINRTLVQDFVIYAHMDLAMVKTLLEREPMLINAFMDWAPATGRAASAARRTWGGATSSNTSWRRGPASTSSAPP